MKFLFISIAVILQMRHVQGQNKFATCNRVWTKIGCFHDRIKPSRPLPEMLINDRDSSSRYHQQGYRLNWNKWSQSTHSLACRCAQKALQKGYKVFGLQYYGECWSGPFAEFNYSRDGRSNKCIMNLVNPMACVKAERKECVGQRRTNYIYMLTANPAPQSPDIDGGFTKWSTWTQCSKTCGGGKTSRERTCTNPKPLGNGKPCEGNIEETVNCSSQPCDCDKVLDVLIALDISSSVHRDNFEVMKTFILKLVDEMPISHRMAHVALLRYNHKVYLDWDLKSTKAQYPPLLKASVNKLGYRGGGTRIDKVLQEAYRLFQPSAGAREDVPSVLLLFADGKTSSKSIPYSQVIAPLKKEEVRIIAIGIGPRVDEKELETIAMNNPNNVLQVNEFDELSTKINEIISKYCYAKKKRKLVQSSWFNVY